MTLYPFVLDYGAGTYVSQVSAASVEQAPMAWADSLRPGDVRGMGQASFKRLSAGLAAEAPQAVNGLRNTWCVTALVRGQLALIHFIATLGPAAAAKRQR